VIFWKVMPSTLVYSSSKNVGTCRAGTQCHTPDCVLTTVVDTDHSACTLCVRIVQR